MVVKKVPKKTVFFKRFSDIDELQQKLIELYYVQKLSQTEIASIFDVCQSRISQLFKELGLVARNMSDAVSLAKSKGKYRAFDPNRDERLAVELNALIHTDFDKEIWRRKIRIRTSTTHLGMIILLDRLAKNIDLPTPKCEPRMVYKVEKPLRFKRALDYDWTLKLVVEESFNEILEDHDKNGYVDRLSRTREELLPLYLARIIECDGTITLTTKRGKITGKIAIYSKDYPYILSIERILRENLRLPANHFGPDNRDKCIQLYMRLTNQKVMSFLEEMDFLHPEKMWMKELALKYVGERARPDIIEEIDIVKGTIKLLRGITVQLAKEWLSLPRGRRSIQSSDLIKLVLQRYLDSQPINSVITKGLQELLES
jgi:predicted DNA-binding protein YlxM (UPF0122 family)